MAHRQLPPEIVEYIVDCLCNDVATLRSCTLTCRTVHIRSRHHLFYSIGIDSNIRVPHSLSVLLIEKPALRSLIHSVTVILSSKKSKSPGNILHETALIVLLPYLPNLNEWQFRFDSSESRTLSTLGFRPIALACMREYRSLKALHLSRCAITFADLSRILESLTLRTLDIARVAIKVPSALALTRVRPLPRRKIDLTDLAVSPAMLVQEWYYLLVACHQVNLDHIPVVLPALNLRTPKLRRLMLDASRYHSAEHALHVDVGEPLQVFSRTTCTLMSLAAVILDNLSRFLTIGTLFLHADTDPQRVYHGVIEHFKGMNATPHVHVNRLFLGHWQDTSSRTKDISFLLIRVARLRRMEWEIKRLVAGCSPYLH